MKISTLIAEELKLQEKKIQSTMALLDEGNTVPFISRYRKEATGNLTETEVTAVAEKYSFFKELLARKEYILQTIEKQGKLTEELQRRIDACFNKNELEDLYLPYKPKRRTKAQMAREMGFEPLAEIILAQKCEEQSAEEIILSFANEEKGVTGRDEILEQALFIVAETVTHHPEVRKKLRAFYIDSALITSGVKDEAADEKGVYMDYYEYNEPLKEIKSHRLLALNRGEKEGILKIEVAVDEDLCMALIRKEIVSREESPFFAILLEGMELAYFGYLHPSMATECRSHYTALAEDVAIDVFERNLNDLLLGSPAFGHTIMGIDPGLRTGSKIAVIDERGKYLAHEVIHTLGEGALERAYAVLKRVKEKYDVTLAAVGNGKGSKEIAALIRRLMKEYAGGNKTLHMAIVNESGASIYSASPLAVKEFPGLDVTIRGAVSIARRIHDPLAEFVKINPKSLGVGQYQHDVDQKELKSRLDRVVSRAVNSVGVDVNSASVPLLSYVAGISETNAKEIVNQRDLKGGFVSRDELTQVKGIGDKTFEQCAGFLRIRNGKNVLDNTAIHPERYSVVEKICAEAGLNIEELSKNPQELERVDKERYKDEVGAYTLEDILEELKKPGRDVREAFEPVPYNDMVESIDDLSEGMVLPGIITNMTNFGLFVDLGIGISGLCHISQAADRFIKDLSEHFRVGDRHSFQVISVDRERERVGLKRIG
ncbi:MAG TPA: RNA-binding transcriptional accessory protein [Firmicutes bacterium]|nr:RNA-binding transcriptional accessory protein [Bacillota bacterium]